ncbi:RNA-binding protein [Mucilaginibacter robiniae]|uniref:RNA-binding protein n=1 Tax=Mucilaginibacter robiniae TaxID=2728022 RepID=A0A7L5E1Z5_9SPHI|nr:RNA-binding protein [Mucilaginibacter robiniae]QJD97185.1 RNA-binding protein [Mucilaginibacter robiniae]
MVKLFVSGFPLEISEIELAMLIAPHGDIATLKIVRDKKTRKCKGYAFVEMLSEEGAVRVSAALYGLEMQGRELTVKISVEQPVKPAMPQRFQSRPQNMSPYKTDPGSTSEPVRTKRPRRPL